MNNLNLSLAASPIGLDKSSRQRWEWINLPALFILCFMSQTTGFCQVLPQNNRNDKEAKEMAYLVWCIKGDKNIDSLIEWKLPSFKDESYEQWTKRNKWSDSVIDYSYKKYAWRVHFFLKEDTSGLFLKLIDYWHMTDERIIFSADSLNRFKVTAQTRFGAWMSKDRLSCYFCMITPDYVMIWVLSGGNIVYTSRFVLGP